MVISVESSPEHKTWAVTVPTAGSYSSAISRQAQKSTWVSPNQCYTSFFHGIPLGRKSWAGPAGTAGWLRFSVLPSTHSHIPLKSRGSALADNHENKTAGLASIELLKKKKKGQKGKNNKKSTVLHFCMVLKQFSKTDITAIASLFRL